MENRKIDHCADTHGGLFYAVKKKPILTEKTL